VETEPRQGLVDFLERLFTEVGNAQQCLRATVEQVANGEDPFFFEAIGGSNLQIDFGNAQLQTILSQTSFFVSTT
jgi:hypothetical protein